MALDVRAAALGLPSKVHTRVCVCVCVCGCVCVGVDGHAHQALSPDSGLRLLDMSCTGG